MQKEKILVVDDDPSTIVIVREALSKEGYAVEDVSSGHEALSKIEQWSPDLVLLDINMPKIDGLDTLKLIRNKPDYISTVFLSGNSNIKDIIKGLDAGADDYICKPFNVLELLARVRAQLRIKSLQRQLEAANDKLKHLVDIDDLTGLYNMRSLYERLENEMERSKRFGRCVAVIMMDMDHFKSVNDSNDHLFGSFVLSEVGKIIKKSVRKIDIAARYGGDEFLIVLTEVDVKGVKSFCQRLRKNIEKHIFKSNDYQMQLTCSLGFAITSSEGHDVDARELVKKADEALYDAKEQGRNCVCYFDLAEGLEEKSKHFS